MPVPLAYRMTMAQQRPVEGPPVPGQERISITSLGIDLGSRFASQLGFEGVKPFEDGPTSVLIETTTSPPSPTNSKKKKKKRRKKKEKQATEEMEQKDEESDDSEEELAC